MLSLNCCCFQDDSSHFQTLQSSFPQPCCSDTKTKLQVHHCAIVLRQLHFFSLRINQQNFRWRSHQLSCNFWNVNVALTRVRCTLGCFDLTLCAWSKFDILTAAAGVLAWQGIWIHFFDGLLISDFFLVFTDVARLNWPFAWWFLSSFWLLSAEITFALIAGASVWRG